jgi:hypothetical protein
MLRLILLICVCMFAMACEPVRTDVVPIAPITTSDNSSIIPAPGGGLNVIQLPAGTSDNGTASEIEKGLEKVAWIYPGKVYIGNLFPGSQGEWTLRVHNEKDVPNTFLVYLRHPDWTDPEYGMLPEKFDSWIIIEGVDTQGQIEIAPQSVKDILITVKMPSDHSASGKKYETWIGVKDNSQTGMIQTELCSRMLISTQ